LNLNPVTAAHGRVFVSEIGYFNNPSLYALDTATGDTLWSKSYGSVFSANPPSYAYGNVYIQTGNHASDTYLRAYDAGTGDFVFQTAHAAQWERYYAPTIFEGAVYVNGGYYGGMYAFDAFDGQELWYRSLEQYDQWTPAADETRVYAYVGGNLHVVDRPTGASLFDIPDPNFAWNGWSMNLAPVLGGADVLFDIHNSRLLGFDPVNQTLPLEVNNNFTGQPSVAGGTLYTLSSGALNARDALDGSLLWGWTPPTGSLSGTIIITNSHVFVGTAAAVYAIDLTTHTDVWSYPVGGSLALSEGTLYIAGTGGVLTAIGLGDAPSSGASADLVLYKKGPAGSLNSGEEFTYTMKVINNGPHAATGVTVTDTLPAGLVWVSSTPSQGSCNGTATITCDLGTIDAADLATVDIVVNSPGGGDFSNTADVSSSVTDPNLDNNTATTTTHGYLLSITKTGTGSGTLTSVPAGINCGGICQKTFHESTTVTLTATADTGSEFGGWTGDSDCSDGIVTMTAARNCTATFTLKTYALTITYAGSGSGTTTGAGPYAYGQTASVSETPNSDSAFGGWTGPDSGECATGSVLMNSDKSCTATFTPKTYALTITHAGSGSGTTTGGGTYAFGQTTSVTETPNSDSTFGGWTGPNAAECAAGSVIMNADKSCTATFNIQTFNLSITKAGNGSGTVSSSPAGINCGAACSADYPIGEAVTLSAVADSGSVFIGWEGEDDCLDGAVIMDAARNCTAHFSEAISEITIPNPDGNGQITLSTNPGILEDFSGMDPSSLVGTPSGLDFPYGMFNFRITGLTLGQSVTITLTFPQMLSNDAKWYWFNPHTGFWVDVSSAVSLNGAVVTMNLTDGGIGDSDGVANGIIDDPVGPATLSTGASQSGGGGSSNSGFCFIATAAYGSYLDPHVKVLRDFRDRYLLTNEPGRIFVSFYYSHSPPLADFISRHEMLRAVTRWALTPLIFMVEFPKTGFFAFTAGIFILGFYPRRSVLVFLGIPRAD